jgi:hypothetical protein
MKHVIKDFTLELIDEPLQSHVVAWEQAVRALKNEDAKPLLGNIMATLRSVRLTDNTIAGMVSVLSTITESLEQAIRIIDTNETLTMSADRGVMVKAAIQAGWILFPELKPDDVDNLKPWLVAWISQRIRELYEEVLTIPKA